MWITMPPQLKKKIVYVIAIIPSALNNEASFSEMARLKKPQGV